jgi:hypothetical protein
MNEMDRDSEDRLREPADEATQAAAQPESAVPESAPLLTDAQPPASTESFGKPVAADAALTDDGDIRDDQPAQSSDADEAPAARIEAREA